jgi:hypothetical protein
LARPVLPASPSMRVPRLLFVCVATAAALAPVAYFATRRTALVPPTVVPDAGPTADAGAPPLEASTLFLPASPATPPTLALHPVPQYRLRELPTHFDPSGRLVARCVDASCEVWERATGVRRGTVSKSALVGYRTSDESLQRASLDGALTIVRSPDGAVALQRGGEVLVRAGKPDAPCADVGAWKKGEPRVAIPCVTRILLLDAEKRSARWSEPLEHDGHITGQGVWGKKEVRFVGNVQHPSDEKDLRTTLFTWDPALKGPPSHDDPNMGGEWAFDAAGACVFAKEETCGCDCHTSLKLYGCGESDGAKVLADAPAEEFEKPIAPAYARSGLAFATITTTDRDHGLLSGRITVTSVGPTGTTSWSRDVRGEFAGLRLIDHGKTSLHFDRRALIISSASGDTGVSLNAPDDVEDHPALSETLGGSLLVSRDEGTVVVTVDTTAIGIDVAKAAVAFRWDGVTNVAVSPAGGLVVGTRGDAPRVEVRHADGSPAWLSPEGVSAKLVGWLESADGSPRLAVDLDGVPRQVAFGKDAPAEGPRPAGSVIVTDALPTLSPRFRAVGDRTWVRRSDGARMIVGDDHVYPQGEAAESEWSNLDADTRFRLGDDVLDGPLLERKQVDSLFLARGSFRAFLEDRPLPVMPSAVMTAPPKLVRGKEGAFVTLTATGAVEYVEVERAGTMTRFPLTATARSERLADDAPIRARACRANGSVCSPWEMLGPTPSKR